ncbi:MAG: hypothetical protein KKC85_22865 [Gammaproteobacteria bacterium]|nr:hypothetical protein [Gammaproteobacteria bacterium]MBU1441028.1 hypothetical protein [Gammaproteobacteria bacterium]MBU2289249.1 hypothetical protein [Gammaproteobacteria bacterium]
MLGLFVIVCGLAVSQHVGQAVLASLQPFRFSSWCWSFVVQYVICLSLLVFVDHTPWADAISPAITLTVFVRLFYFIKKK